MMKRIILFIFISSAFYSLQGQDNTAINKSIITTKKNPRTKSLTIFSSFFNHSISVPFHKIINTPVHPGAMAGIEARYFETKRSKLFQSFNLGMFYNKYNGTGFFFNTELGYRYTSKFNLSAETLIGLGKLRIYHPVDIYRLTDAGTYEKAKDKGLSSSYPSFALGLGYKIKSSTRYSVTPFIRYQFFLQTKYNPDIDPLPHAAFHIGGRLTISKKKTTE